MKAADSLYVVVRLKLDGEDLTIRWRNFTALCRRGGLAVR